jgi:hypothetical protein
MDREIQTLYLEKALKAASMQSQIITKYLRVMLLAYMFVDSM